MRFGLALAALLMLLGTLPTIVQSSFQELSNRDRSLILIPNCGVGTIVLDSLVANATLVSSGSSGTILFSCGPKGTAFTVARGGNVVPHFSLPREYDSLKISTDPTCSSGVVLKSRRPTIFGVGNGLLPTASYNYCASFSNAPSTGLPSFTITWTQHSPQPPR